MEGHWTGARAHAIHRCLAGRRPLRPSGAGPPVRHLPQDWAQVGATVLGHRTALANRLHTAPGPRGARSGGDGASVPPCIARRASEPPWRALECHPSGRIDVSPIRSDRCVTHQVGLTERIPADKVRGGIGQRRARSRKRRSGEAGSRLSVRPSTSGAKPRFRHR